MSCAITPIDIILNILYIHDLTIKQQPRPWSPSSAELKSKNSEMLISRPVTSCLTNHSELCMSRLLNNQSRRISIYRLHRRPSFGLESSVSSTSLRSDVIKLAKIQINILRQ